MTPPHDGKASQEHVLTVLRSAARALLREVVAAENDVRAWRICEVAMPADNRVVVIVGETGKVPPHHWYVATAFHKMGVWHFVNGVPVAYFMALPVGWRDMVPSDIPPFLREPEL